MSELLEGICFTAVLYIPIYVMTRPYRKPNLDSAESSHAPKPPQEIHQRKVPQGGSSEKRLRSHL